MQNKARPSLFESLVRPVSVGLLGLALLVPDALVSQETRETKATLVGVVIDQQSGAPLHGALIALRELDRGVWTDSLGRFSLPDLPAGVHAVTVAQLGYDTLTAMLATAEEVRPVRLSLVPEPMILEGIEVVSDRFRERRNAAATSVRAFERGTLLSSSAQDAWQFVQERTGITRANCRGALAVRSCAHVRGRTGRVAVFIDDMPAPGGLDQLAVYQPHDLYLVEVYGGGRHIRAYTNWYMNYAAEHRVRPMPFVF